MASLKERYIVSWKEVNTRIGSRGVTTVDEFEAIYEEAIKLLLENHQKAIVNYLHIHGGGDPFSSQINDLLKGFRFEAYDQSNSAKARLLADYKHMAKIHSVCKDVFAQEDKADRREKVRLLLFRMATAFGIAAIVFGLGWVSQVTGVALPGIRVLSGLQ